MSIIHLDPLDRSARTPLYCQIAEQIRMQISEGRLPIGTRLPTVRELSSLLHVTRLTAQSAYRELQSGGWIESTVGRGTYVAATADNDTVRAMIGHDATPDQVMRDIERLARLTGLRSMAYAEPDPALAPVAEFLRFFSHPNAADHALMQYGSSQGDETLRVELVNLCEMRGVPATPEDIIITAGVMQGLSLTTGVLTRPGDCVAVERPTYLGMLHVLNTFGVNAVSIPMDEHGAQIDALERLVRERPIKFFYTIPTFQNPTGICLSPERRQRLLDLARRYDFMILEDDIYGFLSYDGKPPPAMRSLDPDGERIIYLSSLSKILMPGIRIGYIVVPPALREQVLFHRQAIDLSSPMLLQRATAYYLRRGRFKPHMERMNIKYRERRDELVRMLALRMPKGVQWTQPTGGFSAWVTLPGDSIPPDFYQTALTHGIAFTPGEAFLTEPDGYRHIRLCFGGLAPELIREAITILGRLLDPKSPRLVRRLPANMNERPIV
jgi:2-aminoadipate transaminase